MQACSRQSVYCVPLYDTLGKEALVYILGHAEISICFVQGPKLTALGEALASKQSRVKTIIYWDQVDTSSQAYKVNSSFLPHMQCCPAWLDSSERNGKGRREKGVRQAMRKTFQEIMPPATAWAVRNQQLKVEHPATLARAHSHPLRAKPSGKSRRKPATPHHEACNWVQGLTWLYAFVLQLAMRRNNKL